MKDNIIRKSVKNSTVIKLLQIGNILHFSPIRRRRGFRPKRLMFLYMILQSEMCFIEESRLWAVDLSVFSEDGLEVEDFPYTL
jgi:hypothetical protein